jgi:hypothetical protein
VNGVEKCLELLGDKIQHQQEDIRRLEWHLHYSGIFERDSYDLLKKLLGSSNCVCECKSGNPICPDHSELCKKVQYVVKDRTEFYESSMSDYLLNDVMKRGTSKADAA